MDGERTAALDALSDALLAIASERDVDSVLQRLVEAARELAGARYAALGVPDGTGAFARFLTAGMSDELIESMGPLPRTHGLLGAMLESERPYRTGDIREDERFQGWWPPEHPEMRSFLGVPLVGPDGIAGAFYLTEKEDAEGFDAGDERLICMLAAHAAIAIENARLHERSRELSIVEERNRLARELHDSVAQKLFGVVLAAEAAATLHERGGEEEPAQLRRVQALSREAMDELRSVIFALRPVELESEGLATTLRKHVDVLRRAYGRGIELELLGAVDLPLETQGEIFRIAQEALANALRHAEAKLIAVRLDARGGRITLAVTDDGSGFDPSDPAGRSRSLGLTSMEERGAALGGSLSIESAPGEGTTVRLELAS
jgi:signal transduction histidine kinase